jgi:activating signal cointegrator 1
MTYEPSFPSLLPIISLWQPYASLVFERIKRHETRGKAPPLKYVGGFIGIHATATFPPLKTISEELHELCMDVWGCSYNFTLPQGVILGTVKLSGGLRTEECQPANNDDRVCGDWRPGRFAWPLSEVSKLATPIAAKGKQGWWMHHANGELTLHPKEGKS